MLLRLSGTRQITAVVVGVIYLSAGASAGPPYEQRKEAPAAKQLDASRSARRAAPGPTRSLGASASLAVTHVEFTQGIQDETHAVALLANRGVFVRVFMDLNGDDSPGAEVEVVGKLTVTPERGAPMTLDSLYADMRPKVDAASNGKLEARRGDALNGLIFLVPAEQVQKGSYSVRLTEVSDARASRPLPCANCASPSSFSVTEAAPPMRLRVLGITYVYKGITHAPRPYDYEMIGSWLKRAYPVSQVIYDWRVVPYPNEAWHPQVGSEPKPDEFTCREINEYVSQIRALDVAGGTDPRTHYYGLVFEPNVSGARLFMRGCGKIAFGGADPKAVGSGPTGTKNWGWDMSGSYGGWYTAHELGHTLGRRHVGGVCNEVGIDPNYPNPGGVLSGASGPLAVAFDPGGKVLDTVLPPIAMPGRHSDPKKVGHDVMSYCHWQWLSPYNYKNIFQRLVAEDSLSPAMAGAEPAMSGPDAPTVRTGAVAGSETRRVTARSQGGGLLHVTARLEEGWEKGKILSTARLAAASENAQPLPGSPIIETLDAKGQVLKRYAVAVYVFTDHDDDGDGKPDGRAAGMIDADIPFDDAIKGIRITYGGKTLDERMSGNAQPEVREAAPSTTRAAPRRLMSPKSEKSAGGATTRLQWEGRHAAAKSLTYTVQVSTDGGTKWQTLVTGITTPSVEIPTQKLKEEAAGKPIRYRVIASDGFNATVLEGDLP
jgi:hypothetical protein